MNEFGIWFLSGIQINDTNYVYAEGDTVFYLQNNQFQKLFDFSKNTGDTYRIGTTDGGEFCDTASIVDVVNVGIDNLGYQFLTLSSPITSDLKIQYGNYNSRFGGGGFLFPQRYYNCDPLVIIDFPIFSFKCFQDDSLTFNPSGEDCEYLLNNVGLDNLNRSSFTLGPNPADQMLNIKAPSDINTIEVFDTKGKLIMTQSNQGSDAVINISSLATGLYVVKIHGHALMAPMKRFVKL
jgi:hypothetical protein